MADQDPIRVLLVDDEEMALQMTRATLDRIPRPGFVLDHAFTFAEGEALVARGEHDVYLVDYLIGEDSGIDLVRRAREAGNRAPMILITGKGRYEVDVEAMEAGVSDYLEKGRVDPDLMERSIRYAMDRARAEARLRDSEARHRSMFDHLAIGLYRTTVDGDLVDANPALVRMLGHPDRETMDSSFARNFFVNPAHRDGFLEKLGHLGTFRGFESDLTRPDGRVIQVRNAARSHQNQAGETVYIEGAVEDISGEWDARDLHAPAARFTWVFERSGTAILILDLGGTILDANPAFFSSFGYRRDEVRGRSLTELSEGDGRPALGDELAGVASGRAPLRPGPHRFVAADGGVLPALTRTALVRTPEGEPDHLMVLLEDVGGG